MQYEFLPGEDTVTANGIQVTVDKVLSQDIYMSDDPYRDGIDLEFLDRGGNYRHYKSGFDGGSVTVHDRTGRQWTICFDKKFNETEFRKLTAKRYPDIPESTVNVIANAIKLAGTDWSKFDSAKHVLDGSGIDAFTLERSYLFKEKHMVRHSGKKYSRWQTVNNIVWDTGGISIDSLPEWKLYDTDYETEEEIIGHIEDEHGCAVISYEGPMDAFAFWQENIMDERLAGLDSGPINEEFWKWLDKNT